jgi:hypothetical protein
MRLSFVAAGLGAALLTASAVQAQMPPLNFDQAAYITCKDAHAMNPAARKALAEYLAEHAARRRGVTIPDGPMGTQLAHLVRGGCTLSPDAYLFTVIDRAILAEQSRLPKRQ